MSREFNNQGEPWLLSRKPAYMDVPPPLTAVTPVHID